MHPKYCKKQEDVVMLEKAVVFCYEGSFFHPCH